MTEVAVHDKMEQVCHGQGRNSFVDSVLTKATIVKQNNGRAYALVARDDIVDANDDAHGISDQGVGKGLPDHFMVVMPCSVMSLDDPCHHLHVQAIAFL